LIVLKDGNSCFFFLWHRLEWIIWGVEAVRRGLDWEFWFGRVRREKEILLISMMSMLACEGGAHPIHHSWWSWS
jgi:hypothetical protein